MSESLNILPELIEASRDGVDFYAEAAETVKDSELSKLFRRMAEAKSALVQELSNEVAPPKAKTRKRTNPAEWVSHVNATYTALRGGLKVMKQDQVTQIEQAEADLLGRVQRIRHVVIIVMWFGCWRCSTKPRPALCTKDCVRVNAA